MSMPADRNHGQAVRLTWGRALELLYRRCADGVSSLGEAPGCDVPGQPIIRKREGTMTQDFIDMMHKFGDQLQVPKLDLDNMIETHRKNLEALTQSASTFAEGAQVMAQKQREIVEAGLREAQAMAQQLKAQNDLNLARQTEFAKKVFDIAVQGAQETAQLTRMSTGDAVKILQDRMREGLEEIRGQGCAKR
jgi:phasin family protein